jgi:zinc-binding alcohol dehydrogenase/oxidoreductase
VRRGENLVSPSVYTYRFEGGALWMGTKMNAVVVRKIRSKEPYVIEQVDMPIPGDHEVLVKLEAAAFNRRDIFITEGKYPGIKLPATPGADGAGYIAATGAKVDKYRIGSEVVIYPAIGWGDQERVYGENFSVIGMPTDGTFAEYIKVPIENVFLKPDYLSWEEAAALPLGGLTAFRALVTRGGLREGESVFIPGIGGGVATFLLQIAVCFGARVVVSSGSDEKINRAVSLGAIAGVNYRDANWERLIRKWLGHGYDVCIDSIGGEEFPKLINLAKQGSRIVTLGATAGSFANVLLPKIFLKQLDILGTTLGSPAEFSAMLSFFTQHKIHPVIDSVYPFVDIASAFKRVEEGMNFGKVVVRFG